MWASHAHQHNLRFVLPSTHHVQRLVHSPYTGTRHGGVALCAHSSLKLAPERGESRIATRDRP
jgi:hypothetical protein